MDGSRWNICVDSAPVFGSLLGSWRVWGAGAKLQTLAKLLRLGGWADGYPVSFVT